MIQRMESPVVITMPGFFDNEAEAIAALIREGARRIHIRKPGADRGMMQDYLSGLTKKTDPSRLTLHHAPCEAVRYGFSGVHLRMTDRDGVMTDDRYDGLMKSVSCHSIEELKMACGVDYAFLSPVFDSISKPGYRSAFDPEQIAGFLKEKDRPPVIALGGVNRINIKKAVQAGFEGVALLGAVWSVRDCNIDIPETVKNFNALAKEWRDRSGEYAETDRSFE